MSKSRIIKNMNLEWKFLRGDEPKAWYKGFEDINWRTVTLPHDWSVEEPFDKAYSSGTGYLPGGIGWYRKTFTLEEDLRGKRVYITFDGVYNNSQVWCNSYYIGKRPYGYSSFTYDITDFVCFGEDRNIISVKVDHKDIADSRWFTGSGIYRDVHVTITDQLHIDEYGVFVTTPEVTSEEASVKAHVRIVNETASDAALKVRNTIFDENKKEIDAVENSLTVPAEKTVEIDQMMLVQNPKLWSTGSPSMYSVVTEIIKDEEVIDHIITPTGIRWFEFDPTSGFFLNGSNMKIKGVCIHHDAGCLGAAVTEKVWARRLKALKEMGCNAIRMSHNPPGTNLLNLCDNMGFLVMDEAFDEWEGVKNKWWAGHNVYPPKHFGYYEDFPEWGERDIKEMVLRDRNHPSIIIWSIGNEVDYPNDPYCHPSFSTMTGNNDANKPAAERVYDPNKPNAERLAVIAKRLASYVKECDTTRPVTAALAFPELSNMTGYSEALDIVGYNYKEHLYEEDHKKFPGRVTYGSENNSSLEAWLAVENNDHVSAQFIWTGIDYLGEAKGWPVRVATSGFLDTAGFKKPKYFYRKSLWSREPVVFLSVRSKQDPDYEDKQRWDVSEPHWNFSEGEEVEIICYTNCEEAELFINHKPLGIKHLKDSPKKYLLWEAAFQEGNLKVVAKDKDGRSHSCELISSRYPGKLSMSTDTKELAANGQDMAHIELQILDDFGCPVYIADREIRVIIEGPGDLMGLENGNPQDLTSYSSKTRSTFNGKLLAYVRAQKNPGLIVVKAEVKDMEPAVAFINVG